MAQQKLNEMIENFALFDDWEERYRYLIDLGRALPALDDSLKTEENLVRGCTSKVWLIPEINNGKLYFQADSDAHIVRGLVALLTEAYNGLHTDEIGKIDIEGFFSQIGMNQHLSPSRRNGFFSMVEKIKEFDSSTGIKQ